MNPTFHFQLGGDLGTYQTATAMRSLINKSFWHPWIRERAALLVASCNRDKACEEQRLMSWVHSNVSYIHDPAGLESLHDPVSFYEARLRHNQQVWGDCDDMSIYLASLLKAVGHEPRLRIIGRGNNFTHVHIRCHDSNLDPSMQIGFEPRHPTKAVQIII